MNTKVHNLERAGDLSGSRPHPSKAYARSRLDMFRPTSPQIETQFVARADDHANAVRGVLQLLTDNTYWDALERRSAIDTEACAGALAHSDDNHARAVGTDHGAG
jgi:hypothetical protein